MAKKTKSIPKKFRVLGIETSCDETSVALLETSHVATSQGRGTTPEAGAACDVGRVRLVKHFIATQIPIHARYGGVVPEIAARTHVAEVVSLLDKTLKTTTVRRSSSGVLAIKQPGPRTKDQGPSAWGSQKFDAIAVTRGPGLSTALRVGVESAKALAWVYDKPLMAVNHLEGHLASAWLVPANRKKWKFPILFLLVSGGHTELVLAKDFGKYKILGRTRDDAAGEAFDKTAKILGLPYPGGPHLSKLAKDGDPKAFALPRPMLHDPSLDFSFSGLKTAVRQLVESSLQESSQRSTPCPPLAWSRVLGTAPGTLRRATRDEDLSDLCASIQAAIVDVLVAKTVKAAKMCKPMAFAVVGGVSANIELQQALKKTLKRECPQVTFLAPAKGLHTDNGAMIAAAGVWNLMAGKKSARWQALDAEPDLDL